MFSFYTCFSFSLLLQDNIAILYVDICDACDAHSSRQKKIYIFLRTATDLRPTTSNLFQKKDNKYLALSKANSLEFLPIIFEIIGNMHPRKKCFLDGVLSVMLNNREPRSRSYICIHYNIIV